LLLCTTFSPTTTADWVVQVGGLAAATSMGFTSLNVTTVDGDAVWPNQADWVPASPAFDFNGAVLGASGFFADVPGYPSKATGAVDLYVARNDDATPTGFDKVQLSVDKANYFYHKAILLDCNGDGLLDVMAARVTVPSGTLLDPAEPPTSELVCMLQPPAAAGAGAWAEVVVFTNGPDVSFVLVDLDNDGAAQVVASEYFVNQRLAIYSCNGASSSLGAGSHNNWVLCAGGANVSTVVIDDTEGAMFNVAWVDLDGDGTKDLLATSQGMSGSGRVLAYLQPTTSGAGEPSAWRTEPWPKHVLADGYKPKKAYLPGRGSPGTATPFAPPPTQSAAMTTSGERPWLAVSADDGGWVDLLVPPPAGNDDPSANPWLYAKTRVVSSSGTVGTVAAGDVDGDGVAELFVPLYDENRLAMYKLVGINNASIGGQTESR
jgi:hypothetical protein